MQLTFLEQTALGVVVFAYLLSLGWAIAHLTSSRRFTITQGRVLILVAFVIHTIYLIVRAVKLGTGIFVDISDSIIVLTWCVTLIYGAVDRAFKVPSLPAFFIPINVLLTIGAAVRLETLDLHFESDDRFVQGVLSIHIVSALVSYAAFAIGVALGIMYLIQERQLKAKRTGALFRGLPSLEANERVRGRVLGAGFASLTLSLIIGALSAQWTQQLGQDWFVQSKIIFAGITWVAYAVLMHLRLSSVIAGRRLVYMTIGVFFLLLFTYVGTAHA